MIEGDDVLHGKTDGRLEQRFADQGSAVGAGGGGERQAGAVAEDQAAVGGLRLQRRAQLRIEGDDGHLGALDGQLLAVDIEANGAGVEAGEDALDGCRRCAAGRDRGCAIRWPAGGAGGPARSRPEVANQSDAQGRQRQGERLLARVGSCRRSPSRSPTVPGRRSPLAKTTCSPSGLAGRATPSRRRATTSAPAMRRLADADGPAGAQLAQRAFRRLVRRRCRGEGGRRELGGPPRVTGRRRELKSSSAIRISRRSPGSGRDSLVRVGGVPRVHSRGMVCVSLLQDGQVVVGHLQDDAGHRGAVVGAEQVGPGAVG